MKDLIKEVALEVAQDFISMRGTPQAFIADGWIPVLMEKFLAELSKRAEASSVAFQHEDTGRTTSVAHYEADDFERLNRRWFKVGPLFTFPPIHDIEAIENRVAEACIKALKSIDDGEAPEYSHCLETLGSGEWRKYK